MKGNPYENTVAERVNGILKAEFSLDRLFKNLAEVKAAVENTISVYNEKEPRSSCDYLTPQQAHQNHGSSLNTNYQPT
jgi:transposase InsO family protein